jgi:hypothetical protein
MEPRRASFDVVLLFYVKDASVRRVIEANAAAWAEAAPDRDLSHDHYTFRVFVAGDEQALAARVVELLYQEGSPTPLVVVSDELLAEHGGCLEYATAPSLIANAYLAHGCPTAFIALGDFAGEAPKGLVARVATRPLSVPRLQEAIGKAAMRLHLLAPPRARISRPRATDADGPRYVFRPAATPDELLSSFELRYAVYDVMGYLGPEVVEARAGLELDFHDGMSLHYVACDVATGEVAASVRLVVPDQPWAGGRSHTIAPELRDAFETQRAWFRATARAMTSPALQRALLDGGAGALPMLQNARPQRRWAALVAEGLRGAELSRTVVPPKSRGAGLSRALVHLALTGAYDLGKRAVFAECFPSHVAMYKQYGFNDIEGREATPETWGSFYFTPSALSLEIANPKQRAILRFASALFKMANARIALREKEATDDELPEGMEA